ncbi:MAG: hypothetical protein SGJ19_27320 [Planctomycetia bacterium]|nr:hypothetical protein [Planctomycetia bacterium]
MKNLRHGVLAAFCLCLLPSAASAALIASVEVAYELIPDGRTRYEYTLSNAPDSEFPLDLFLLDVGENVAIELETPFGWFADFAPDEQTFEILYQAEGSAALAPGESAKFIMLSAAFPDVLPYFVANLAQSSEEGGYVFDFTFAPTHAYPLRPGDTNSDGVVDVTDLNNVRNNFAKSGNPVLGDTDPFDGTVGLYDLNQVYNNYGRTYDQAMVPEPATAALALAFAVALVGLQISNVGIRMSKDVRMTNDPANGIIQTTPFVI